MKKHTYRSKKVNQVNWEKVKEQLSGQSVLLAIDVAKDEQYGVLSSSDPGDAVLLRWDRLDETMWLIEKLKELNSEVTVVMESTSTYGDGMRYQFRQAGFEVHQVSAKRVHDAREIYDGVPSMHDGKAAWLIARLYKEGATKPWRELDDSERALNAQRHEYELHQNHYLRNQNRLEALLNRHWPEVLRELPLDSVTLESLLIAYGSPEQIAVQAEQAARDMRGWGKSGLSVEKIERVITSTANTLGQPCIEAERVYLQALAEEMRHSRLQMKRAKAALEAAVEADEQLRSMRTTVGAVTTAILIGLHLDPRHFGCARSYLKALGLNLKEKSSGQEKGRLKLTKRGSALARKYLYFATLRLIKSDPVVALWYRNKTERNSKLKTVVALMRKLAKALWHVARGERFDANKLLTVAG